MQLEWRWASAAGPETSSFFYTSADSHLFEVKKNDFEKAYSSSGACFLGFSKNLKLAALTRLPFVCIVHANWLLELPLILFLILAGL